VRRAIALVSLAVVLYQQPFLLRAGKNRAKVVPLQLALNGALSVSLDSPMIADVPGLQAGINASYRALLTPLEYVKAPKSKRSVGAAFAKTEKRLSLIATDANLRKLAAAPTPNAPVGGAGLVTAGSLLGPLLPGVELAVLAGCACLMFGVGGMSAQPELYFVALLAVAGLLARRSANAPEPQPVQRRPRRPRAPEEDARCDDAPESGSSDSGSDSE
jgi:hypothetical protein